MRTSKPWLLQPHLPRRRSWPLLSAALLLTTAGLLAFHHLHASAASFAAPRAEAAATVVAAQPPPTTAPGDDGPPWRCQATCCWRRHAVQRWPYAGGAPAERNISGMELAHTDSFKGLADIVVFNKVDPVEQLSNFYGKRIWPLDRLTAPCLQPSSVIFIQQHWFRAFAAEILPLINTTFVLVSHDGDEVMPGTNAAARALLDDPRLLHWFAMSCAPDHPKLSCLPLGPSLWRMTGDTPNFELLAELMNEGAAGLRQGMYRSRLHPKPATSNMLVNFQTANWALRAPLWNLTCLPDAPLRDVSTCPPLDYGQDMRTFFRLMAAHRFVLAPRGAGPDTYRCWEALLAGSYPIVPDQDIAHLYAGLPVLVLRDMHGQLTPRLLEDTYVRFTRQDWSYQRLFIGHWQHIIYQHRAGADKSYRLEYRARV